MIRILLAEDQAMVRGALAALLNLEEDFEVVAEASDGEEAIRLALETRPDIALLDVEMPKKTGLEVVESLKTLCPETTCIVVTTFARPGYLQRAMRAGARGYLLKASQIDDLAAAIRQVRAGRAVIDPSLMQEAWALENPLTDREAEVLRAAATGVATRDIAAACHLSEGTVRNYLSQIISKLEAKNRQEAVQIAVDKGWI